MSQAEAPKKSWIRTAIRLTALVLAALIVSIITLFYYSDIPAEEIERRYADSDSQFVDIAGSRVHFKDVGGDVERPALLLIHGTASSLHTWDAWAEQLGEQFRILRLDLPGYGLTGANRAGEGGRGDYSNRYRLQVIDALMEQRGVDRLAVAGNSLGGLLAWRYAAEYPDRVAAAILLDPAGAPRPAVAESSDSDDDAKSSGFRVIDLTSMPGVNVLMTKLTPRFLVESALQQVYADPSKVSEELIQRHHDLLLREGNRQAMVDAATQRNLTRTPPTPVSEVRQPVLIQWGREDLWIPASDAELFHAALPDSELIVYDDVGHLPMEEIAEQSATDALDFLQRRYLVEAAPVGDTQAEAIEEEPVEEAAEERQAEATDSGAAETTG